ncbi:MAG: hypothetical protein ACOC8D_03110 [bacterium]
MSRRILLIESDPTIRKHLAALLERVGHSCSPVDALEPALREARRHPYPLIIVDLDDAGADLAGWADTLRSVAPDARLLGLDSTGTCPPNLFDVLVPKPFLAEPLLAALPGLLPADGP